MPMHKGFRISQPGSDYEILAVNVETPVGLTFGNWIKIHAQLSSTYDLSTANAMRRNKMATILQAIFTNAFDIDRGLWIQFLYTQPEVILLSNDLPLTHWGLNNLGDILQNIFKLIISIKKFFIEMSLQFVARCLVDVSQHWFRSWFGAKWVPSHCLNQWWPSELERASYYFVGVFSAPKLNWQTWNASNSLWSSGAIWFMNLGWHWPR